MTSHSKVQWNELPRTICYHDYLRDAPYTFVSLSL
jgi:hypothetical protein